MPHESEYKSKKGKRVLSMMNTVGKKKAIEMAHKKAMGKY